MNILRICLSVILLLFSNLFALSQSVNTLMGGRALGVANASATLTDEWSILNNIGGLSKVKALHTAFAYEANPTLLGANRMAVLVTIPTAIGTTGMAVFKFGDELYSEQIISTGFSNGFGNTSLGVKLNFIQYRSLGYNSKNAFSVTFGGVTQLTSQLAIGAYIVNLNQPTISSIDNEKLPTRLVAGLRFKASDKVSLFTEVEKDLQYLPEIKGALEYNASTRFAVRTGFNLQPEAAFFGVGYVSKQVRIDYALQYNQNIRFSYQVSMSYQLPKSQRKK